MNKTESNAEEKCNCPVETTTAHHEEFPKYERVPPFQAGKPPKHCDLELISGCYQNNLEYKGQIMKSKVWPGMLPKSEEYADFLKRLESDRKDVFDHYFRTPPVDQSVICEMFNDMKKTSYQLFFSPDCFVPVTEKRRFAKLERLPIKYEETTYGTYHNNIMDYDNVRDILRPKACKENKEEFKKDFRTIKYAGRSTYNDEISVLGKVYAKPTLPPPIDRYTLRRV